MVGFVSMICFTGRSDIRFPFCCQERATRDVLLVSTKNSSLYELHVERDGYLIADQKASALERRIPAQAEVLAADFGGRRYPNARVAPRVLCRWSRPFCRKDHLPRDVPDGQV